MIGVIITEGEFGVPDDAQGTRTSQRAAVGGVRGLVGGQGRPDPEVDEGEVGIRLTIAALQGAHGLAIEGGGLEIIGGSALEGEPVDEEALTRIDGQGLGNRHRGDGPGSGVDEPIGIIRIGSDDDRQIIARTRPAEGDGLTRGDAVRDLGRHLRDRGGTQRQRGGVGSRQTQEDRGSGPGDDGLDPGSRLHARTRDCLTHDQAGSPTGTEGNGGGGGGGRYAQLDGGPGGDADDARARRNSRTADAHAHAQPGGGSDRDESRGGVGVGAAQGHRRRQRDGVAGVGESRPADRDRPDISVLARQGESGDPRPGIEPQADDGLAHRETSGALGLHHG